MPKAGDWPALGSVPNPESGLKPERKKPRNRDTDPDFPDETGAIAELRRAVPIPKAELHLELQTVQCRPPRQNLPSIALPQAPVERIRRIYSSIR